MNTSFVDYIPQTVKAIGVIITITLPFMLWGAFYKTWIGYVRQTFWNKQTPILLEILLPKQIDKTPNAMELFLLNLNQTSGESTWYDRSWLGKTRPWFSLELVSTEGKVRFFIWSWSSWKKVIETQLYAQYPGIEVTEVKDYTKNFVFNPDKNDLWGFEMKFAKEDAYPIKTYRDYGIGDDSAKDEEIKVDPITPTIEFLGSIGQKQQCWIQFIVRAHKDETEIPMGERWSSFWKKLGESDYNTAFKELFKKRDSWKDDAKELIKKIREEGVVKVKDDKGVEKPSFANVTKGQTERINAIERSIAKPGYDVGIRGIYIADKEFYDGTNHPGVLSVFKQYNSHELNSFVPKNTTSNDYPWQNLFGSLLAKKQRILKAYRARGYFYYPWKEDNGDSLVLNSEELATVYHFPGQVVQTPSFDRVLSKKAEPPGNLPV
jgi:hypothetical protein